MADEKKPKIDLKARLGKTAGPGAIAPASVPAPGSIPSPGLPAPSGIPAPFAAPSSPAAPFSGSIPAPAASSAAVDALGTLGMNQPFRPSVAAAPPPPARIEMDESTIQDARRGAFKTAAAAGFGLALLFGLVGYVAGGALEKSSGRTAAMADANALEADVAKSKTTMETLLKKLEEGKAGIEQKKYPAGLGGELGGINVDFDGLKLGGRRFSGFKTSTTQQLVAYITSVQELNTKKNLVATLLAKNQKSMTDSWTQTDKVNVQYIVLLGGPKGKDPAGNPVAILAPLVKPHETLKSKFEVPDKYTASFLGSNVEVERFKSGTLEKAAGMAVLPNSVEAAFPSESTGAKIQLLSQLSGLIREIKGEEAAKGKEEMVQDVKAGMLQRADALIKELKDTQK
jgi:hypothetical protein